MYQKIILCGMLGFYLGFLMGCTEQPQDPFANCKYKKPTAIFSPQTIAIAKHQFEVKQKEGIEQITFANGLSLEVIQSGCHQITQDFYFTLEGQFLQNEPHHFWVEKTIEQFMYLGHLGEAYAPFTFWAQAIQGKKEAFRLGEAVHLEATYFVEINKILSADYAILTVKLFENSEESLRKR